MFAVATPWHTLCIILFPASSHIVVCTLPPRPVFSCIGTRECLCAVCWSKPENQKLRDEAYSQKRWEEELAKLMKVIKTRKGKIPSKTDRESVPKATWKFICRQRELQAKGSLEYIRVQKLETITGRTWDEWETKLERLKKVILSLRRLPSQTEEDSEARAAGIFIMNQRQLHQEGLLVPGRVHKLEAIPGWTWSTKLEAMWEAQLERLKKVVLRLKRLPSQTEEDSEAQEDPPQLVLDHSDL